MTKLGIIGTALRGKNTEFDELCTKKTYEKMLEIGRQKIKELNVDTLVSGGAAFSDHIAVHLFNEYLDEHNKLKIEIYYPTVFPYNFKNNNQNKINNSVIYYHKYFAKLIDNSIWKNEYFTLEDLFLLRTTSSLKESNWLTKLIKFEEEKETNDYSGFFTRNTKIANNSDYLLIFSYFDNEKCLTNGSTDTINKFLKNNTEDKLIKIDIRDLN